MKTLLKILAVLFLSFSVHAQVGIGTTTPNGALDITSTTDGLLIPRVILTSTILPAPVITPTDSELVYNTGTTTGANAVSPGFYSWNAALSTWIRFGGSGWLLDGNPAVTAANFMGSINDADVAFRRENMPAGKIGTTNTSFGLAALSTVTGIDNTAIGVNALSSNLGGVQNVAVGFNALTGNLGSANIGIGWNASPAAGTYYNNVAIGFQSLSANTQSSNNTTIGFQTLTGTLTAASEKNVAVGFWAMQSSTGEVIGNSFLGAESGRRSTGNFNTGVGYQALTGTGLGTGFTTGIQNTAVGYLALQKDGTGAQNTAVGAESLEEITSGSRNTAIGFESGRAIVGGDENTVLGYQAGNNITSGGNNTAIGFGALVPNAAADNQIRIGNTAITVATTQVGWTNPSDRRWKESIKDSGLGLDFLQTLRPVSYIRKNDNRKRTEYGFIAQELEIALNAAGDKNNAIISKDDAGMYGVRYNDFISITVKAVQEQQALIEALQKQNEELLKANAAILKRLEALENK
jgi:hypothetical protein